MAVERTEYEFEVKVYNVEDEQTRVAHATDWVTGRIGKFHIHSAKAIDKDGFDDSRPESFVKFVADLSPGELDRLEGKEEYDEINVLGPAN